MRFPTFPPKTGSVQGFKVGIFGLGFLIAMPLVLHQVFSGIYALALDPPTSLSKAIFISISLPTAMVAAMTFVAGILPYGESRPWLLTVLGPTFLALAILKLAHLLALEMNPGHLDVGRLVLSNTLARLVVTLGFIAVVLAPPGYIATRGNGYRILAAYLLAALLGSVAIWIEPWGLSELFVRNSQFTVAKFGAHGVLGLSFILCAVGFLVRRDWRGHPSTPWLAAACTTWAIGEWCHAMNTVPYGRLALVGHAYFLLATILAHLAVFKAAFILPLQSLTKAQAESRVREERLQLAFEGAEEGYWDWDLESGMIHRSAGALSVLGYFPEEVEPTLDFMDRLVDPEALPEIRAALQEHLEGKIASYRAEYRCRTRDGCWIWVLDQGRVVQRDDQGRPVRMAGTIKEISIQKQMESALKASEAEARKLALVASHTENLVIITDAMTHIEWVNSAFMRITGYASDEVQGWEIHKLIHGPNSDPVVAQYASDRIRSREGYTCETQGLTKAGQLYLSSVSVQPILDESGVLSHWICIGRDITEEKKGEEALRQTQKLESLGLLASGIAHDFNNLLSAIRGNVDLARLKLNEGKSVDSNCNKIEIIVERAADLTRQLMAYAGKGALDFKPVDLNALITEITTLLSVSLSKNVEITYHLSEELPLVVGDSAQLQQVVMNLVINGSDALGTDFGKIQVRTEFHQLDENEISQKLPKQPVAPGPHVLLIVTDSGCGMTPDTQARIFDPFFTTKTHGRGLGLSAMLGILRSHHAGIHIESIVGVGTTFRIFLPLATESASIQECAASMKSHYSGKCLVVDDEKDIRQTSAGLIEAMGFEVWEAKDGLEATEIFIQEGPFELVLMDVLMPRMDGFTACKVMAEHSKKVRIIHCSGTETNQTFRETCGGCERRAFLLKPFGMLELQQAVRRVMNEKPEPTIPPEECQTLTETPPMA